LKRLQFCLLIPLTFIAKTSIAQNLNTTLPLTPNILSSSGFVCDGSQGLTFSVGSTNSVIFLSEEERFPESDKPQDTTNVAHVFDDSISQYSQDNDEATNISIYPNPFIERITLNIENFANDRQEKYRYQVLDLMGNILVARQVVNSEEEISLSSNVKGIYVLLLYKNEKEIKSFKLIKSNL